MNPTYCPRCGKPLLPDASLCPFCGLEGFVPDPPEAPSSSSDVPPPGSWPPSPSEPGGQPGWGVPRPDQSSNKTVGIVGCLILVVLLLIMVPIALYMLTASQIVDDLRHLPSFPADFPFPSFGP